MKRDIRVVDLMTTALVTVRERDTISHADAEMRLAGVRHLPVIDDRQNLVGILSNRDLLGALAKAHGKPISVAEVMTRQVETIATRAPARRAAALMLERKIGSLPVLGEDGQLVGLVTETDFLRLAYELLS